jgi:hypothetical protein
VISEDIDMTTLRKMRLLDIIVPTGVARAGMTIGEVFEECVARNVPGLPYCDEDGQVIAQVSIRHTLKNTCIPKYMVKAAHLLGDKLDHVNRLEVLAREILEMPVEPFLLENIATVTLGSPVVKALAIMEQYNSGYIFLIEEGVYQGIVTRLGIAALMLRCRQE